MTDFPHKAIFTVLTTAAAVWALTAASASAQTQATAQTINQAQDQVLEQQSDKNHLVVSLGAAYAPRYQGSDDHVVRAFPAIDAAWGPLFANLRAGIGVKAIDNGVVTAGVGLSFMPGRKAKYVPEGIGKLSVGAAARGFVNINAKGFVASFGAKKGVSGDNDGVIIDASFSRPIRLSPRLALIPTVSTSWTDKTYNNAYFGVDAAQSLTSGLPQFQAGSGFKDVSALLTANYRLTPRISLAASGGVTRILGDVQDSPLVLEKTQPVAFASVAYRF